MNLKIRPLIVFWLFISQVLLLSCAATKDEPQIENVEDSNIDNQVHAKVYELMNTLETVNPVILEVQSLTPNTIVFKNNLGVRIFKETDNGWKEIKEKPTTRLPEDDVIFS